MDNRIMQKPLKVLLAVDGSEHALAAVHLVHDLPLSTVDFPESVISLACVMLPRQGSDFGRHQAILDHAQALLSDKGVGVTAELLVGSPAEMLLGYAEKIKPDVIVMGAKGLRATLGILLGGVAQQLLEYAPAPVLVVRAPYTGLQRVLLVVDGSRYSQCAQEYLGRFPLPPGCKVEIFHVLPPVTQPTAYDSWQLDAITPDLPPYPSESISGDEEAAEETAAREMLEGSVEVLETYGVSASSSLTRGDAATEIIRRIQEYRANLVVCGSRGLSPVRAWLLGSVSRKLVHYAACSALVVKM